MKTIKIISFLLIAAALCACSGTRQLADGGEDFKKQGKEPARNYPVFLQGDKNSVAFKLNIKYPGQEFNAALTINKASEDAFKIKVLADFATVVIDADFIDGQMRYKYVLGNMFDKKALDVFESIMRVLLVPPQDFIRASDLPDGQTQVNYRSGDFMNRYYFKKGISFPYKMEQTKITLRKKCSFNDYDVYDDTSLPAKIVCEESPNIVAITLTLINIK